MDEYSIVLGVTVNKTPVLRNLSYQEVWLMIAIIYSFSRNPREVSRSQITQFRVSVNDDTADLVYHPRNFSQTHPQHRIKRAERRYLPISFVLKIFNGMDFDEEKRGKNHELVG